MSEILRLTPIFRERNRGAQKLARVLLEFRLKHFYERQTVGSRSRESPNDVSIKATKLSYIRLQNHGPESHLPVSHQNTLSRLPNTQDRC